MIPTVSSPFQLGLNRILLQVTLRFQLNLTSYVSSNVSVMLVPVILPVTVTRNCTSNDMWMLYQVVPNWYRH